MEADVFILCRDKVWGRKEKRSLPVSGMMGNMNSCFHFTEGLLIENIEQKKTIFLGMMGEMANCCFVSLWKNSSKKENKTGYHSDVG